STYAALACVVVSVSDAAGPFSAAVLAGAGLYALTMAGLGLASAGVILVSKEGEPIAWAFGVLSGVLGGVCFPQFLLPDWLAVVGRVLPTTHALAVVRAALTGAQVPSDSLVVLAVTSVVAVLIGAAVLRWGFGRARSSGTISRY
ncbi:ABC transporter permease, partial [bacterium]|nr:ABC transporter permease [bacterium]